MPSVSTAQRSRRQARAKAEAEARAKAEAEARARATADAVSALKSTVTSVQEDIRALATKVATKADETADSHAVTGCILHFGAQTTVLMFLLLIRWCRSDSISSQ